MAITIDWATKVISVPKADTVLVDAGPPEIRELNIDTFRLELKNIEDSEDGMAFLDTHSHNPPVTVGGVTLARVVEIINGYTVEFEDGQYAVNLVGANSNISDVTVVNQVSIRSANSAGLTYSKQVEDTAFYDARVWVDTDNGTPGTIYPQGTTASPVDNLADAQTIISLRDLPPRLHLRGDLTIGASDSITSYNIFGESSILSTLAVTTGAATTDVKITGCGIQGDLNGKVSLCLCMMTGNLDDFDGSMIQSGLNSTITLGNGGASDHLFIDCFSDVAGTATPIIDCNSHTGLDVQFRRYAGGLEIRNFNQSGNNMSIDLTSGNVVLASTCTAGTIVVRGTGSLTDNSGVGCTVVTTGLVTPGAGTALTQQQVRDSMDLSSTGGKDSIDDKLDNNFSISAAGL